MLVLLALLGWLACVVYSTVPAFWLLIHGRAEFWRQWRVSPYVVLIPLWMAMWVVVLAITWPLKNLYFYSSPWAWLPAAALFALGAWVYRQAGAGFSLKQLGGVPELHHGQQEQRLITMGIRQRVRHPVYLGHLLETLAWSVGTGLVACFALTAFAMLTGAVMIRAEDAEMERRFGEEFRLYRVKVPALVPIRKSNSRVACAVYPIFLGTIVLTAIALIYCYQHRDKAVLFYYGTLEVPQGRTWSLFNPLRDRTSERTAERLIADLHSGDCLEIAANLRAEAKVCNVLQRARKARLIFREDHPSRRLLVYDLPEVGACLYINISREESGFVITNVSLLR